MQAADPIPPLSVLAAIAFGVTLLLPLACSGDADGSSLSAASDPAASRPPSVPAQRAPGPWFEAAGPECGLTHRNLATVIARRGVLADPLSKVASVLPPERANQVISTYPGTRVYIRPAK